MPASWPPPSPTTIRTATPFARPPLPGPGHRLIAHDAGATRPDEDPLLGPCSGTRTVPVELPGLAQVWKGSEGGCDERGQPAKRQSPAWACVLGDVTHDGATDRCRPQEGDCPQGHYPSAHGLVCGHLQHVVPAGHEADAAGANHRQGENFGLS